MNADAAETAAAREVFISRHRALSEFLADHVELASTNPYARPSLYLMVRNVDELLSLVQHCQGGSLSSKLGALEWDSPDGFRIRFSVPPDALTAPAPTFVPEVAQLLSDRAPVA